MSLPEGLKGKCRSRPVSECLFKVDKDAKLLDDRRKDQHHGAIAKCLRRSQRSRPDLHLSTLFHCTRVKSSSAHDWANLVWLIGYLHITRYPPLTIETDGDGNVHSHIDGAHTAHADGKGHSGLQVTMANVL